MQLEELIRARRSVGAFTDTPVSPELVQELLETAVWVPNHKMTEPWRFVFITGDAARRYASIRREMTVESSPAHDEAARQQAGDAAYRKFAAVPAYLAVIMRESENPVLREEDFASCACLVQNFLLLAWQRGLGTSWKTFKDDSRLREFLGLASDEKVAGWLYVGYPADEPPQKRRRSPVGERFQVLDTLQEGLTPAIEG